MATTTDGPVPEGRTIDIEHFSDVLCIWAYVAEVRLARVRAEFGDAVRFRHRFCSVFGDSDRRIADHWGGRGGFAAFGEHVREVGAGFGHVTIHPDLWAGARPVSSASPHLFLHAVGIAVRDHGAHAGQTPPGCKPGNALCDTAQERAAAALRHAFFAEARDVSTWAVQAELAETLGLPVADIRAAMESGAAFARLADDYEDVQRLHVQGSPTLILDGGRQKLYGNVGFRVIEANIQEQLRTPDHAHASWC